MRLMPGLVLLEPFELEGQHTVPETDKLLYLDHHWDDTFGYAFGTVLATADNVTEVKPGDFVTFTRHAYLEMPGENDAKRIVVNIEDCEAIIEVDKRQGVNRVDGDAA